MKINEIANLLGEAIKNDEITKEYHIAQIEYDNDAALNAMIDEYQAQKMGLDSLRQDENVTDGEIEAVQNRIDELYGKIFDMPAMKAFTQAQERLNGLLESVNAIISFHITGEQEGGCTPDKCGGCQGCGGH